MAILSTIPEIFLNYITLGFLMQNFNLGIAKMSVISKDPLFPNLFPKASVDI